MQNVQCVAALLVLNLRNTSVN